MGQVVGSSNRTASLPAADPVSSQNVMATIMSTLFDRGQVRINQSLPTEVSKAIDAGRPIAQLV